VWAPICGGVVVYALARYALAPFAGTPLGLIACVFLLFSAHALILVACDRRGLIDALKIVPGAEKYVP
jgi:hypothetical protein